MKLVVATMLLSLVFIGLPCPAQTKPLIALRERVERYYRYFSQQRYDLMWRMSSRSVREKNDNDEKGYIRQAQQYGFGKVRAEIIKIDLDGDRAKVRVKISVWSKPDRKWLTEVDDEMWVIEKGRWVFEDQRVAEGVD
jgi:hypothetical protein